MDIVDNINKLKHEILYYKNKLRNDNNKNKSSYYQNINDKINKLKNDYQQKNNIIESKENELTGIKTVFEKFLQTQNEYSLTNISTVNEIINKDIEYNNNVITHKNSVLKNNKLIKNISDNTQIIFKLNYFKTYLESTFLPSIINAKDKLSKRKQFQEINNLLKIEKELSDKLLYLDNNIIMTQSSIANIETTHAKEINTIENQIKNIKKKYENKIKMLKNNNY